jgi:hypothetical protein
VRAYTRLLEAAKALTTRDYVRGISRLSTLFNRYANKRSFKQIVRLDRKRATARRRLEVTDRRDKSRE